MTPLFVVRLPMPPSTNNAYVNLRRGRALSSEAKRWKETAYILCLAALKGRRTISEPDKLLAILTFEAPDWECKNGRHRKVDLDGKLKLPIDAVAEACLEGEDERIYQITSRKVRAPASACVVELWPMPESVIVSVQ